MKRWIEHAKKLAWNRRGNAMLEFAIGAGVLVAAFTGTFQYGYTFLQYNNLKNAVARGARYASLVPYDSPTSTPSTAFSTAVKNMVVYGSPTAGASAVLTGLTTSNVNLSVSFGSMGMPDTVTVSITGYTINSIFSSTTLNTKPKVTYNYQGVWSPVT
jgi:Flp pilus assembly protein TadG